MVQAGGGYIIFYLTFYAVIGVLGLYGFNELVGADVSGLPVLDDTPSILDTLAYSIDLVLYFSLLGGLTILGVPAVFSTLLSVVLTAPILYIMARLVRGGG